VLTTSRIGQTARRSSSSSRFRSWISLIVSGVAPLEHLGLHVLQAVAEVFEEREARVDDGVEQGVHQEAGVVRPEARVRRLQPLPHAVPHVAGALLEREHRGVAEEDADLLAAQVVFGQLQHLQL
jgi:hypothetical protein